MGLHDRIKSGTGNGSGATVVDLIGQPQHEQPAERVVLDPYAELKTRIHHACIDKLGPQLFTTETNEDLSERVLRTVTEQLALDRTPLTREERRQVTRQLTDDILGYGPLEPLLRDDSVTEVMVNGHDHVYIERSGKLERTSVRFVDESSPMVDARLPDGSGVNAITPPLALTGATLTIRKFSRDPYTINDLISFGTLSAKAAQFLAACVK